MLITTRSVLCQLPYQTHKLQILHKRQNTKPLKTIQLVRNVLARYYD